jgi:DNA polymerase
MTVLSLDLESRSELFFGRGPKNVGLDRYSKHGSTQILMLGYAFDDEPVQMWDCTEKPFPRELKDALRDPGVEKHAFNAQFERVMFRERWGLDIPYEQWRCTLALSYMLSFIGGLDEVGECVGLPDHLKKDKRGEKLIAQFSSPQRVTKANPYKWRDGMTDPHDWQAFKSYCMRDVEAERAIWNRLAKYPIEGWRAYWLDQKMNDRGLPVDRRFLEAASTMAARRKEELTDEMKRVTGLANPNSSPQFTGWLRERGYPFNDIGKDTVKKVLTEDAEDRRQGAAGLPGEVVTALKLRQQVARTSVKKFDAVLHRLPEGDDTVRYAFQFAGASRTNRWASRGGVQLHNMPRTPGFLEDVGVLEHVTSLIRDGDYDGLREFCEWCVGSVDILDALVGCVRSMIRAPDGYEFVVSDLSSIETVGIGVLSGCERILNVFREGKDAYKDYGTVLFHKTYDEVTKKERSQCKPPVLACGFGIAGGELEDGRWTGLMAYAEGMGIPMTRDQAHAAVDAYHVAYPEVRPFSWALKDAMARCIETGVPQKAGLLTFKLMKPFMLMVLPSGRPIYYHLPRVHYEQRISRRTGNEYTATVVTVMGKSEAGNKWVRRAISPGLGVENADQAMCRDVLVEGKLAADDEGFDIRGSVHDEIITLRKIGDERYSPDRLGACMTRPLPWLPDAPLGYGAFSSVPYRKE